MGHKPEKDRFTKPATPKPESDYFENKTEPPPPSLLCAACVGTPDVPSRATVDLYRDCTKHEADRALWHEITFNRPISGRDLHAFSGALDRAFQVRRE